MKGEGRNGGREEGKGRERKGSKEGICSEAPSLLCSLIKKKSKFYDYAN